MYDDAGRLEPLAYPDGSIVDRGYTARGQLTSVSHDLDGAGGNTASSVASFTYHDSGRETSRTHGNGVQTDRAYVTGENLVSGITVVSKAELSFGYTYDENKNVTSESRGGTLSGYGFTPAPPPERTTDANGVASWSVQIVFIFGYDCSWSRVTG